MKYIGEELENFESAHLWRRYTISFVKKYLKNKDTVEIGSGLGSFSELLVKHCRNLALVEPDKSFTNSLKKKFSNNHKIKNIVNGTVDDLKGKKFEAIVHFQVLEHIKDDQEEINKNLKILNDQSKLIVCVPAFMSLYSKFDKSIGHFRRYEKKDFEKFNLGNSKIVKMFYIDSIGYILYKIHSFFVDSTNPSQLSIMIWDKVFIPLSFVSDFLFNYKFGKNLIVIIEKHS